MFRLLAVIVSNRWGILGIVTAWILATAIIFTVAPSIDEVTSSDNSDFLPGGAEAVKAIELSEAKFTKGSTIPAIVVLHRDSGLKEEDWSTIQQIDEALRSAAAPQAVAGVLSVLSNPFAADGFLSEDGRTLTMVASIEGSPGDDAFETTVDWIRETVAEKVEGTGLRVAVTGPAGILTDAVKVFSTIDFRVTFFTVILVLVLLLVIYRSPLLALLPLMTIGWALFLAQSVAALMADRLGLSVNGQVTGIMSVLVFGAGTDFTLFIVSRYKEELIQQPNRWLAMRETVIRIGPAISSSAGTTIVAMIALLLARDGSLHTLGPMLAMAVFIVLVAGLTLIPALAVVMGRFAFWPSDLKKSDSQDSKTRWWTTPISYVSDRIGRPYRRIFGSSGFWNFVANAVARRPGFFLLATSLLLVILALGIPSIRPSYNFLEGMPANTESRIGFELLQESFPPGELAPTEVYVSLEKDSVYERLTAVEMLSQELDRLEIIASVAGPTRPTGEPLPMEVEAFQTTLMKIPKGVLLGEIPPTDLDPGQMTAYGLYQVGRRFVSSDGTTVRLDLTLESNPYNTKALDSIEDIRALARNVVESGDLAGSLVLVGGETATSADARSTLNRDIIVVAPIVLVAIWLILALLVRSVVAPTYLLASVLLSFAAALGLSIVVFQNILGHSGVGYSNSVFMFIFLVALGADYNIYIISRVREEVGRRGLVEGTRYAVSQTGAVITSAGVILAGTFSVLTTLPLRDLFQLGFAVMLGVLLDTFIVRGVLVPSVVLLLKDWNWWPYRTEKPAALAQGVDD